MERALDKVARNVISTCATNQLCDLSKSLSLILNSLLFLSLLTSGFLKMY